MTHRTLKRTYALYAALQVLTWSAVLLNPVAFHKSVTIREAAVRPPDLRARPALEVDSFLRSIPYRSHARSLYLADPRANFYQTIIAGDGNCSNMIFGTAYLLDRVGIDYAIIHILPQEGFLEGKGHVVLRAPHRVDGTFRVALIDVSGGGLPESHGQPLDLKELSHGPVPGATVRRLGARSDKASHFHYTGLLQGAHLGFTPAQEVRQHFRFLEAVYVPLGNAKVEKYVFGGLEILLGIYPHIYVTSLSAMFDGFHMQRYAFHGALWMIRSLVVCLPLMVVSAFWARAARRHTSRQITASCPQSLCRPYGELW